jgi:hypothetical protein
MPSVEDFLYLPSVRNIAYWNSLNRNLDPVENWTELWQIQMAAHGDDPTNRDWKDIEIETIRLTLEDNGWPLPDLISLYDHRKALFKFFCNDMEFNEEDQMLALFERAFGVDVWQPKVFTAGANSIFHCLFNNCPVEENTLTQPDTTCYRKIHVWRDGNFTYNGLKNMGAEELITWSYTLPTFADLSALTVRVIVRFKHEGQTSICASNGGNPFSDNGAWTVVKQADNKLYFGVYDGTSLKLAASDDAINNEFIEVYCVVDGTTIKMYIDGMLQTVTDTLDDVADWYSEDKIHVGDSIGSSDFKGSIFELAIDHEVITP